VNSANHLALWLAFGVAAGTVTGLSTGHLALGVAFGIGFAVGVAGILARQAVRPTDAAVATAGTSPAASAAHREA
jgi:hypothetical protein